jgi:hypothetical protein
MSADDRKRFFQEHHEVMGHDLPMAMTTAINHVHQRSTVSSFKADGTWLDKEMWLEPLRVCLFKNFVCGYKPNTFFLLPRWCRMA